MIYNFDGTKKSDITRDMIKKFKGFDNDSYLEMLESRAIPSIIKKFKQYYLENGIDVEFNDCNDILGNVLFMQDNATIHTKNMQKPEEFSVSTLFNLYGLELEVWPPRSPDLNPVENLWSFLDKEKNNKLDTLKKKDRPKNKKETFELLKECYDNLNNQVIINCYNSYLERLKMVQKNGGGNLFDYSRKRFKKN